MLADFCRSTTANASTPTQLSNHNVFNIAADQLGQPCQQQHILARTNNVRILVTLIVVREDDRSALL